MKTKNIKKNKGFALLFAVMISSIILAIALGVATISYKEVKFSTSAKDTNDAFFAADTGAECALYYDRIDPANNAFDPLFSGPMNCNGLSITLGGSDPTWNFIVSQLGDNKNGCAIVSVNKSDPNSTSIVSKGYNNGGSNCIATENTVEREIDLNY